MAKLKIHDGTPAQRPIAAGYIRVVDNLGADFADFVDAGETERADLLQTYAAPDVVRQLATPPNDVISSSNCKIKAEPDELKKPGRKSKVTMALPDQWPADFTYLRPYVDIIKAEADMTRACKFLFGVMLLTRCR